MIIYQDRASKNYVYYLFPFQPPTSFKKKKKNYNLMGIQGFLRWIKKQFSIYDIFLKCRNDEDSEFIEYDIPFDSLFLDLNSLIHYSYNMMVKYQL